MVLLKKVKNRRNDEYLKAQQLIPIVPSLLCHFTLSVMWPTVHWQNSHKSLTGSGTIAVLTCIQKMSQHRNCTNFMVGVPPWPAVYRRAGCITSHYLQFRRAVGIPFTTTNTNNMDVQGVSLSTTCSLDVQWVSFDKHKRYGHAGCIPFRHQQCVHVGCTPVHPQLYGRARYFFLPPAALMCRMHSSPSLALWTFRVCMQPFSHL